jgi:pimeloyl-ACP methyl ester carboxylesterase
VASVLQAYADGRIFGSTYGHGEARVLGLHGWARTSQDFSGVLDGLDAVALDLPGFGSSPPPPEAWGSADYAAAIAPIAQEWRDLGSAPLIVVGHSFGGRVAVHLAASHPDLVGTLILTAVPLLRPTGAAKRSTAWRYRVGKAARRRGLISEPRLERLRQRFGSTDYAAATGVMRQVLVRAINESYEEQLQAIRCPIELVWGEQDRVAPVAMAKAAMEYCQDAHITTCAAAGHLTLTAAPACVRDVIDRHLPSL